jgi:hypothetical protein
MTLRRKLLDNQKTLEKAFGDFEEVKEEDDREEPRNDREESPQVEQVNLVKSCSVLVKIEEVSDDENRLPDGSLEKVKKEDEGRLETFEFMSEKSKILWENQAMNLGGFSFQMTGLKFHTHQSHQRQRTLRGP